MRYWIEYADGRCCNFANSRKDLLDWLKLLKDEKIVDIRKIYKSGQDACGRFYTLYPACAFWLGSGVAGNNQNQIDEVDHWRKE